MPSAESMWAEASRLGFHDPVGPPASGEGRGILAAEQQWQRSWGEGPGVPQEQQGSSRMEAGGSRELGGGGRRGAVGVGG